MLADQVAPLARLSTDIALVSTAEEGRLSMRRTLIDVLPVVADATAQATHRYATGGADLDVRVSRVAATTIVDADADRIA